MEPFKNLISTELVGHIADQLAKACDRKSANRFSRRVLTDLHTLEMKDRVQSIANALRDELPDNSSERHALLHGMLHPQVGIGFNRTSDAQGIAGWGIWPLSLIVGQHGVDDFDGGMALLRDMTRRSTAEFAIHYFLIANQDRALANHLNDVAKDHPDLVVDIAKRWLSDASATRRKLVRHACRTLIRQGHPAAMTLFGFPPPEAVVNSSPVTIR